VRGRWERRDGGNGRVGDEGMGGRADGVVVPVPVDVGVLGWLVAAGVWVG